MDIFILVLIGLSFGSFVNALVWRLHEQQSMQSWGRKSTKKRATKDISILNGRSMCVNCNHTLAWYDLIPILSWVSLGGKCRYCYKPISLQYPLVELCTALLFVLSYVHFPFYSSSLTHHPLLLILWLIVLTGFIALIIYDARWYLLPNKIVFPLQGFALIFSIIRLINYPDAYSIIDLLLALIFGYGLFMALFHVSKGKWIGYGDVKLAVVIGLLLGKGELVLMMLFLASLMGSIIAIPMLVTHKANRSTKLPFGPFLIIATIFTFLFGISVVEWYKNLVLV